MDTLRFLLFNVLIMLLLGIAQMCSAKCTNRSSDVSCVYRLGDVVVCHG